MTANIQLTVEQHELLKALDDTIGLTSAGVVIPAGIYYGHTDHAASHYAGKDLTTMEGYGFCRRMDARRPVLWLRTERGTEYLKGCVR